MDTLAYAKRLRAAGVSEDQAEAHAEALRAAVENQVATKADIRDMGTKSDLAELKVELVKWMIGLIVPLYALLVGVLLSLP